MYLGGKSRALCDVCLNLFLLRVKMDKRKKMKNGENEEKKKLEEEE